MIEVTLVKNPKILRDMPTINELDQYVKRQEEISNCYSMSRLFN